MWHAVCKEDQKWRHALKELRPIHHILILIVHETFAASDLLHDRQPETEPRFSISLLNLSC